MTPAPDVSSLLAELDVGLPICTLIDPLLGEPPPIPPADANLDVDAQRSARSTFWEREVEPVPLPARIDLPVHLHPYLVMLTGPRDPWLTHTWDLAQAELRATREDGMAGSGRGALRIGGWLQCESDLPTLAQTLADRMRLRTQAATQARYLRLADRRTLDWLAVVIGLPRLKAGLGPIRRWCWIDSAGMLARLDPTENGNTDALRLTADEWSAFTLADMAHPCVARWQGELELGHEKDLPRAGPALEGARHAVLAARAAAKRWPRHLAGADDCIAWAAMSLLYPGFDETAACRRWLASALGEADTDAETFNLHCHTLRATFARASEHST